MNPTPSGEVSPTDATTALDAIEANLGQGRMPTFGGAVPLIDRDQVDLLYAASASGAPGRFVPVVPDRGGLLAQDRAEWYVAAVEQAIPEGDLHFDLSQTAVLDGILFTYTRVGVDWRRVHTYAAGLDPSVPPFGEATYWAAEEPLSILAFTPRGLRGAVAANPSTPDGLRQIITLDPDPAVAGVARHPHGTVTDTTRRRFRGWALVGLIAVSAIAVFAVLSAIGFARGYTNTVVDLNGRASVTGEEFTGEYNVVEGTGYLCGGGADYNTCVNMHVSMFNSVCVGKQLTLSGQMTCNNLTAFVDNVKAQDTACGFGCTTIANADGTWGYKYLSLAAEVDPISIPRVPTVTHEERCDFDLGIVKFGDCERERPTN